jgi:hypothetical protein
MIRIAFLILAHRLDTLPYLISSATHPDVDIFIHVDKKTPLSIEFARPSGNVFFIEDRKSIFWGGFNMVSATLNMLQLALSKQEYSHFFLLSGDTILITEVDEILKKCSKIRGQFIDLKEVPKIPELGAVPEREARDFFPNRGLAEKSWRFENYVFLDSELTNPRVDLAKEFGLEIGHARLVREKAKNMSYNILRSAPVRPPIFARHYSGSQWWGLSSDVARRVCHLCSDEGIMNFFRYMKIPDEQTFHTIIGNYSTEQINSSLMYVNWERRKKSGSGAVVLSDLVEAKRKGHCFARKHVIGEDLDLDELIFSSRLIQYLVRSEQLSTY